MLLFLKLYSYKLKTPLGGKGIDRRGDLSNAGLRPSVQASFGGKGIRTPDIQLAKLALYQLSYAPGKNNLPGSGFF